MESEPLPRKLAAILYADVAGYSRLTGKDEDATHRSLAEYLDQIAVAIERHGGRVMHYAGDAVLAMFEAVVDALCCAGRIQNDLKSRNDELSDEKKVQFRIGVNISMVRNGTFIIWVTAEDAYAWLLVRPMRGPGK